MSAPFEHIDAIALCRDLTPERAMELQDILASDPAAAVLLREWCTVRASLVREMGEASVDPEQFVLFVLHEYGRADALTSSEQVRVEEIAPAFRQILANSPGLAAVATDIRRDMQDFEAHWAAWFAEASVREAPASPRASSSRSIRSSRSARRDRIPARISRRVPAQAPSSRRRVLQAGIGVAAAAVLATFVFFLLPASPDTVTVETTAAEVRTIELPDGSSVRLLGDSRLTYSPGAMDSDETLRVEFEGRALFDIIPSPERFLLVTPDAQVTVLSTSFGARTFEDGTEVVLVEGSLRMSTRQAPDRGVLLAPGQMSRMMAGVPSEPVSVRVHERLAWTGLFVFHATPVRDILPMLSGHYGVDISADETLLDERVTGRFTQDESLAGTLDIVALAIGAAVEQGGVESRAESEADGKGYHLTSLR